ncbi:MAG: hypothetical protein ACR2N5_03780, partial [Solirubrobacterales bacterium]
DLSNGNGDKLSASITAPRAGNLHIVGSVNIRDTADGSTPSCELKLDGADVSGSLRDLDLDGVNDEQEDCATNAVVPVSPGSHGVALNLTGADEFGTVNRAGTLNVLFVPFDGSGS